MYADRFQDLIVFDISNPAVPIAVDTIGAVFNRIYMMVGGWPTMFGLLRTNSSGGLRLQQL